MKKFFTVALILSFVLHSFGQTKADKARAFEIAMNAIKIMDNGDIEKSIEMLTKSKKLDPKNANYPYEIGYAYFLQKDYNNAIKTLTEVIKYKANKDICFTLLGNIYDTNGQSEKAIKIYKKGLAKFPKSGRLHYELGVVQKVLKKFDNSIKSWENGIAVSPSYSSNYFASSYYYCESIEKIWGVLNGELFMNIERGSERTSEISKLLYDTYKSAITIKSKKEGSVSFSETAQISSLKGDKKFKLPFSMPYQIIMAQSVAELKKDELGIESFNNIRTSFIKKWYKDKLNIEYPNILFDWHKKLIDLGYFESYNYWLLMKGNQAEFIKWSSDNPNKFDKFMQWFKKNRLIINEGNKLQRLQYK